MSLERWRMPSGSIATIDLQQAPEAIEDARNLLREFGDAVLIEEDGPGAGGNQPEAKKTNPEREDPVTTVQRTVAKIRRQLLDTFGRIADALGIPMAELA